MAENLIEGILAQIDRVTEMHDVYVTIPFGEVAASMMRESIKKAKEAVGRGDVIECLQVYEDLKGYTL